MTQQEIKEKIDKNNEIIEANLNPSIFKLNKEVSKLLEENEKLRKQCIHEFDNGICKYCYYQK